jgi:hypothetical protein
MKWPPRPSATSATAALVTVVAEGAGALDGRRPTAPLPNEADVVCGGYVPPRPWPKQLALIPKASMGYRLTERVVFLNLRHITDAQRGSSMGFQGSAFGEQPD